LSGLNLSGCRISGSIFAISITGSSFALPMLTGLWMLHLKKLFNHRSAEIFILESMRSWKMHFWLRHVCFSDVIKLHILELTYRMLDCDSVVDPGHFWYGSGFGAADPCLWPLDPDPAIFVLDQIKQFFSKFFCLLL
jgi:hypothetical protein